MSHKDPHKKTKFGTSLITFYASLEDSAYNVTRRLNFKVKKKEENCNTVHLKRETVVLRSLHNAPTSTNFILHINKIKVQHINKKS